MRLKIFGISLMVITLTLLCFLFEKQIFGVEVRDVTVLSGSEMTEEQFISGKTCLIAYSSIYDEGENNVWVSSTRCRGLMRGDYVSFYSLSVWERE